MEIKERYQENGFKEFVTLLLNNKYLTHKAEINAAMKVLQYGYDSLSSSEQNVFDKYVIGRYAVKTCSICLDSMSWYEMIDTIDESEKTCSGCKKKFQDIE